MGFGSFIAEKARAAGETALNTARGVAAWTRAQAEEAWQRCREAEAWAAEKTKEGAADALGAGMAAKQWASAKWQAAKDSAGQAIHSVQERIGRAVDRVFGRTSQPAEPESPIQPCPLEEAQRKEQTRARRRKLVEDGEKSGNENVRKTAAELKRDMDAVEEARLSDHIYCIHDAAECRGDNGPVVGFRDVSDDLAALGKIGLRPVDLKTPGSNFRAAVFQRQSPPFAPEEVGYVVVFKGTSPTSVEDWRNNFRQGVNAESSYYKKAVEIGDKIADEVGNLGTPRVIFAGHSLGGGLASAAARASGLPSNTFNAAGLNAQTVARYGGISHDAADIHAYHVPGDPLTERNEKGLGVLGWKPQGIQPPLAAGTPDTLERALQDATLPEGAGDSYFHSMPVVIRALERRKGADEESLNRAAGRT